ncbi:nudC domain-containing protein 3 [Phymastichus coffea]|uniref:nudC domain-containing protein 3 n=1 Tax=Phymastichus coffea TaxID=108790 RepID=UPI00273AF8B2|nr:nudC domain-containing protein 3 [Phymastichus coffea]
MDSKHDPAFLNILREEKNIINFLDAFFGFLYRCTDFYVESTPEQKLGFPSGIAEKLVVNTLRKWQNIKTATDTQMQFEGPPLAIEEIEVAGNEVIEASNESLDSANSVRNENAKSSAEASSRSSDSYNGASYENYKWSQTVNDLDVVVPIPAGARRSKDVRVELSADGLEVAVLRELTDFKAEEERGLEKEDEKWKILVKGRFLFKIKRSESYWCLEPGKHINLHLEKSSERWWDALLDNEPRIELSKLDCSRQLEDMGESEQMKVEELMWNQRRKLLGQPTSEQIRMERILQQAWNAEGSPFKGTEYDPSIVKFN